MRDLKRSEVNRLTLTDSMTGEKLVLFYATPTASQVVKYKQATLKRKNGKVVIDNAGPALKFGLEILTGFEDGAFGFDGAPISCRPEAPNYRADWKERVADCAADVVATLGALVFEGTRAERGDAGVEFEGMEEGEEPRPFSTS